MWERIHKLQPNRTIQLLGFDGLGASAAIHDATANSFTVSGTFRDSSDFAVLTLYDADNFYEHPRLKYLPDFNFDGVTLSFDARYTNLMPLDSPHFGGIDWPYLDVRTTAGTLERIRLFDHATQVGGDYTPATGSFTIHGTNINQFDRVTIWYLHRAFDYIVPQLQCTFVIAKGAVGTVHSITVDGEVYSTAEIAEDTNFAIVTRLAAALAASSRVTATVVGTEGQIDIRNKAGDGTAYSVTSTSGSTYTLTAVSPESIAANLAWQIQTTDFWDAVVGLNATAVGPTVHIQARRPGVDGNAVTLYSVSKNANLEARAPGGGTIVKLSGGSSDATWRITLDFAALEVPSIRTMVLTFAPPIVPGGALETVEWRAEFTNWTVNGSEEVKWLKVATPDSVRVEETSSWCSYTGNWIPEDGFYSQGFARGAGNAGDSVTIRYSCPRAHDLYLGTSLYVDRGQVSVSLDGDAETPLNCYLAVEAAVNTRRRLRVNVPPGEHVVVIRLTTSAPFYFDFLEAAVPGDIPAALPPVTWMSPALDYSTDHTYKLPPERVLWSMDQLGFAGPLNEYIGVFWWNQRKEVGGAKRSVKVTFGGPFNAGDEVWLKISGVDVRKVIFPGDSKELVASHFAYAINSNFAGVYATVAGNVLTINSRAPKPAWSFAFEHSPNVTAEGSLADGGTVGEWVVDPSQSLVLNHGARSWHRAMFAACHSRSREITVATSMELVNAPDEFAARFPDGSPVTTSVGFGTLHSTHCAFNSVMRDYQKRLLLEIADSMVGEGLTPSLQLGEFVWWFFSKAGGGMGYYDSETSAAAAAALGRPLHVFQEATDDPNVNAGADATFLRSRLRDHAAALMAHVRNVYPDAQFELLFPYDVNHPVPVGMHALGGRLNRFVNFPVEWQTKATSGLDRIKMEGLDFGAWNRNLDLCFDTMSLPIQMGWPRDSVRYLVPVFRAGSAWERESLLARGLQIPVVNFWAYDHFCLYGLETREPKNQRRSLAS